MSTSWVLVFVLYAAAADSGPTVIPFTTEALCVQAIAELKRALTSVRGIVCIKTG